MKSQFLARWSTIIVASLLFISSAIAQPDFEIIEIDPHIGDVCYAVSNADVDGDGKMDIVAISESAAVWYRNPDWKKFTMIDGKLPRDLVCIAPHDIDRDGKVDFAIGAGWPQNGGSIYWIRRGDSLEEDWKVYEIGAEAWTHRMRFADVLGRGEPQLVVSPLNATSGPGVRLLAYEIPENPISDAWKPIVLDGSLNRVHNHLHVDFDQTSSMATLAASQDGLSLLRRMPAGGFSLERIAAGAKGSSPAQQGSGEIRAVNLGEQHWLLATIEPMHGNQVVVYPFTPGNDLTAGERVVLADSFNQGHGLAIANLLGDELPEIVAGFRQPRTTEPSGPGIIIYQADDASLRNWTAIPLDLENMACEDLLCHDFDGDGKSDVVAGGRASHNVRLYKNRSVMPN